MLAAILEAPRHVVLRDVVDPEPSAGQVRVELEGGGICASELPVWEGRDWFAYPREPGEPGHEGWGIVDALGPGVTDVRAGDRVALISHRAHAQFDVAEQEAVVALPPDLPADQPFPAEPVACAINAVRRASVEPGSRVAVVGCGFQGLLIVALCRAAASEVAAISRREAALELARCCGATSSWRAGDGGIERAEPFDVVFEATGHQNPLNLAARLTRVRGRLVIVGYHQDGLRTVDMQLWNWRGLDVINAHERHPGIYAQGIRAAARAVATGELNLEGLLTHRVPLENIGEAYRLAGEGAEGFVKAVWTRA